MAVSHEVTSSHWADFFKTYTNVASSHVYIHIYIYIHISTCHTIPLQRGVDTKQNFLMFRTLLVFVSGSSWALRKAFVELVLLALENSPLYPGKDQFG